jgi:hypothetical protein
MEEDAAKEMALTGSVAVSLGSGLVLVDEGTRAVLFSSVVVDEELGWRRSTVSKRWSKGGGVEQSGACAWRKRNGRRAPLGCPCPG